MSTAAGRSWRGLVGLLTAEGVSILGSRMSMLAIPWFVLVTTGSATRTGVVAFAEMAPYVLVQGLGGPVVDRVGAWRLSVATDLAAAVAVGLVPLLHLTVGLSFGPLCALVAVAGAVRGAGDTSRYVMVPGVTERAGAAMERGAGLSDGVSRLAGMVGAPLAGVLVAFWSAPAVLVVDAATFVVSALLVVTLVPRSAAPGRGTPSGPDDAPSVRSYLHGLKEGFRRLAADRLLLGIATLVLVTNLVDQAVAGVLAPVWAQDATGSPVTLGLLFGALGAGAVLGNVVFTWLSPRLSRRRTFAWCFLVAGAPRLLAMAAFTSPAPVVALSFLAGVGAGGINPILGAVEYERVPRHLQARVLGAVGALAFAGIPVGALAGGLGVTHLGLRPALVVAGVVYLLATLAPFALPVWRQMERAPVPSSGPSSGTPQPSETVVR